jgi:lipoate-protein ligase A
MLIDAKLQDLKGVLSNDKAGMVSRGVESVPSLVKNLIHWDPLLTHDTFFDAVAQQFTSVYGGDGKVQIVTDAEVKKKGYVEQTFEELQTWEWQWGQTPEFEHHMRCDFAWGFGVSIGYLQ